jgi:hypothetical protein
LRRRLAIYGVVLGLLGATALWLVAPDPWPLQGSRVADLDAAVAARNAGEPPLVGLRPAPQGAEPVRYAVGTTDDQGVYLYAPLLSGAFGLDALDGVKLLWAIMFGFGIAVSPLIFLRLFGSPFAAMAAPFAVFLAVLPLTLAYGGDIYWVPAWAALVLLPPLLPLDRDRPRRWIPWLLGLVVAASFASSIRSSAGLPIALAAAIVVLTARMPWWRRGLGVLGVAIAYLSISSFGLAAVRDYRDAQVGRDLDAGAPTAHSFWHPAYLGLGYLPNDHGIYFRDDIAATAAQREDPGVTYLGSGYDAALRTVTLDLIRDYPGFVASVEARKAVVVVKDAAPFLFPVAILLPAFLLLAGSGRPGRRRMVLLILPAVLITFLSPIVAIPYEPFHLDYEVGLFGSLNLLTVLVVLWTVAAFAAYRHSWRERMGSTLRAPELRRALAWTAGAVVVIAVAAVAGRPIERQATDWQNSAPPPAAPGR